MQEEPIVSTRIALAAIASISLLAAGCAKKAPVPLAPAVAEARAVAPSDPGSAAPRDVAARGEETPDIWSQDIETIDAWAKAQGFLGEIYFDFDRYELRPEARDRLAKNADFLKKYPDVLVTIEGHADDRGTADYNIALGARRASSTVVFLEQLGIDRARLRTVSYGEERPLCTQGAETCWSRNRRAAFVISGRRGT
jgi:peptidoglycan-associated lipoprotein